MLSYVKSMAYAIKEHPYLRGRGYKLMQPIGLLEALVETDYKTVYLKAKAANICIMCKEIADHFQDQSSRLEYSISAICQKCQDSLFRR